MTTKGQHFLLSAKARTLSLKTVFTMGEDKAYDLFCQMRWPETGEIPVNSGDRRNNPQIHHRKNAVLHPYPSLIVAAVLGHAQDRLFDNLNKTARESGCLSHDTGT